MLVVRALDEIERPFDLFGKHIRPHRGTRSAPFVGGLSHSRGSKFGYREQRLCVADRHSLTPKRDQSQRRPRREQPAYGTLEHAPDLPTSAPKNMVHRAVFTKRKETLKLVLDLGFDSNYQEDNPAITHIGVMAENDEILRLLLAYGAALTLRDPAALERPFAERVSRAPRPQDWQTPLVRMVVRGKTEAVRATRRSYFLFNFRLMMAFLRESNELRVLGPLEAPWKSALSS
jgi:hypothetical protein